MVLLSLAQSITGMSLSSGADDWQAYPGKILGHLASSEILEECWGKEQDTCGSGSEWDIRFLFTSRLSPPL